jgi:hypothetical protein
VQSAIRLRGADAFTATALIGAQAMGLEVTQAIEAVCSMRRSELTEGGPNAFSRYERGKAKPLQSVTNLFKLLDNHPELLDEIQMGRRG